MAKDEDEGQSRGFKVQDRRRFVDPESGDRAEEPAAPKSPGETYTRSDASMDEAAAHVHTRGAPSAAGGAPSGTDAVAPESTAAGEAVFGEMSFSTFIMGLTTQALMHLGEIPDPAHQSLAHDLPAAKQMIDLLGILRDKTKGNLDAVEEQLLGEVLYDLRMRYVEMARGR
jgi:hypothetical protein